MKNPIGETNFELCKNIKVNWTCYSLFGPERHFQVSPVLTTNRKPLKILWCQSWPCLQKSRSKYIWLFQLSVKPHSLWSLVMLLSWETFPLNFTDLCILHHSIIHLTLHLLLPSRHARCQKQSNYAYIWQSMRWFLRLMLINCVYICLLWWHSFRALVSGMEANFFVYRPDNSEIS